MHLLTAVQSGSLKDVEDAIKSQGVWTDYEALNTALAHGNIEIAKFLISQNCRVNRNISSDLESSPLHKAVELKNTELVRLLLQKKASISAITSGKNTPLHLAFLTGLTEIVNLLLQHIDETSDLVNCKNDFGLSHFHIACTTENSEVIKKYLKANVNIEDAVNEDSLKWAGCTAYHFATKYKSLSAIFTLLKSQFRSQSMQKDKTDQTPQDLACARLVEYSTMTHIMSEHNRFCSKSYYFQGQSGMPKCTDVDQPTAFHLACMRNDSHLVKAFLERGAPVNIPVSKRMKLFPLYSPLHFAVESHCMENVELLMEYGADVTSVNGYSMTALHLATYNGYYWLKDFLYSKVEDKEKNLTDDNHLSYFHIAVSRNDLALVKKMLEGKQVDVNSQVLANPRGFSLFTPLHFAVQCNSRAMVKLLVEHGADLNVVSSQGTALQMVFDYGPIEFDRHAMFELLLSLGARADLIVGKKTPLHEIVRKVNYDNSSDDPSDPFPCNSWLPLNYIRRVIESGCDVNAKDEDGNTALHYASSDNDACVRRLLQGGADVNIENNEGYCVGLNHVFVHCRPQDSVVCHHVQNLKALGWTINPKLDKECDELLEYWNQTTKHSEDDTSDEDNAYDDDDRDNWQRAPTPTEDYPYNEDMYIVCNRSDWINLTQTHRPNEIEEMKKLKLDSKTTLYDFMRLEDENVGAYANNEVLKSIMQGENRRFWVYGYLIKLQYRKSQKYAGEKATRKRSSTSKGNKEDLPKRKRVT